MFWETFLCAFSNENVIKIFPWKNPHEDIRMVRPVLCAAISKKPEMMNEPFMTYENDALYRGEPLTQNTTKRERMAVNCCFQHWPAEDDRGLKAKLLHMKCSDLLLENGGKTPKIFAHEWTIIFERSWNSPKNNYPMVQCGFSWTKCFRRREKGSFESLGNKLLEQWLTGVYHSPIFQRKTETLTVCA